MKEIPEVVQSHLLSSFCDGKSICTYFHVLISDKSLQTIAFPLIRNALVERYTNLANSECFMEEPYEEVRDVLNFIREDIRTCTVRKDRQMVLLSGSGGSDGDGDGMVRENVSTKLSEWCAIIDYFDTMRTQSGERTGEFILWCGHLPTQGFGTLQTACVSTRLWKITSMDYFYDQLELHNQSITHPATECTLPYMEVVPFGTLEVRSERDDAVLQRIQYSLVSSDFELTRYSFLVPSQMEYEPTMGFALNNCDRRLSSQPTFTQRRILDVHWDEYDQGDFEYSLSRLGENVIRILTRLDNI